MSLVWKSKPEAEAQIEGELAEYFQKKVLVHAMYTPSGLHHKEIA